jgi:hypothetical protein
VRAYTQFFIPNFITINLLLKKSYGPYRPDHRARRSVKKGKTLSIL